MASTRGTRLDTDCVGGFQTYMKNHILAPEGGLYKAVCLTPACGWVFTSNSLTVCQDTAECHVFQNQKHDVTIDPCGEKKGEK